jgi:hypothetical protein
MDTKMRLHAWKRLLDAIDPTWDANDFPVINVTPPSASGAPSGVAPHAIKDPRLRAEYEEAIERNRQKAQRYSEQNRLHKWLKRFPKTAEEYIIRAYSKPPFDVGELKEFLQTYITDEETKATILHAVTKNTEN